MASAITRAIATQTGKALKIKADGWTDNFRCVNPAHDDKQPSAGWHEADRVYKCFSCDANTDMKTLCNWLGLDFSSFFTASEKAVSKKHLSDVPDNPPPAPESKPEQAAAPLITHASMVEVVTDEIEGRIVMASPPIVNPYKTLHQFKGNCQRFSPGILVLLVGLSGGGKTTFLDDMTRRLLNTGQHGAWWGREWTPQAMVRRDIHALGGPTLDAMKAHYAYLFEEAARKRGQNIASAGGVKMPDVDMQKARRLLEQIKARPGQRVYVSSKASRIDDLLEELLLQRVQFHDATGHHLSYFVIDYLQLVRANDARDNINRYEEVLDKLADFASHTGMVGFMATQPKKANQRGIEDGNGLLRAEDATYIQKYVFKLILTLTPRFDAERPYIVVYVDKDNEGAGKRYLQNHNTKKVRWVGLYVDPARFVISDIQVPDGQVELGS